MALPDSGDRLFSISDLHGPSLVDAVGALIAIAAWLPLAALLPTLWRRAPRPVARTTVGLAVLGAVGLVLTLVGDLGWWWVLPVVALVLAQLLLVADGLRAESGPLAT